MIPKQLLTILYAVLPLLGSAQGIVVIGLPQDNHQKTNEARGRTKAIALPFWDDFSDTDGSGADPARWEFGSSVRVNDGMAIRPPSLKTATFDGIDSVGRPYNPNDALAKGYADKLVSQAIDLTTVDPADRNSVYLSYQYQMKGNGELPDAGDRLLVLFQNFELEWIPVDTVENDGTLDPTLFYTSFVKVEGDEFFHEGFKFRIQNFARLSGPYDAWHVDYIYLNKGRTPEDNRFPDRTISEPMTSLFVGYRILPAAHFIADPSVITYPSVLATSMPTQFPQPISYSSAAQISYTVDGTTTDMPMVVLDNNDSIDTPLTNGQYLQVPTETLPDLLSLASISDSIAINYKVWINTRDNVPLIPENPGDKPGEYRPEIFSPIDFRYNDTTRATFALLNKYAYDDGVAEYGAGLNQPGAQLAYEYHLVGVKQENITHLEMYFPRFGDESSQVLELRIWNDLTQNPVYSEVTSLQRSEDNTTWVKRLTEPVPVDSVFYIGWRQSAAAVIAVGLDKNYDTGDKMYYNISGDWTQNTLIHGSLLLRPVFGEGSDVSGLEDQKQLTVYPNPSSGTFYFAGVAEMVSVYDMTGRSIGFKTETTASETKLELPNASQGIYIIKAHIDGRMRTAKVMVR